MSPGDWIALSISDTGTGIAAEHQPHLFEPFYTTKEVGQGAGLGLAQVYGIVTRHEGHIEVESQPGKETIFTLYLPASSLPQEYSSRSAQAGIIQGQGEVILLVEDEPTVLEATKAMLKHLGYRVLAATNGQQALEVYDQHRDEIALVLTDMTMPAMGGVSLSQALQKRNPAIKMVVMTGYPLEIETKELLVQGIIGRLEKPLNLKQLAQIVSYSLAA
jgi:CheY-like chemotaxis protein